MKQRNAASLLELILIIMIMSMGIGVCVGISRYISNVSLRSELFYIRRMIYAVAYEAAATNRSKKITFPNAYEWYTDTYTHRYSGSIRSHCPPTIYGPPGAPLAPIRTSVTFPNRELIMYPNGRMSPGTVYLIDSGIPHTVVALSIRVGNCTPRWYTYRNGIWHLEIEPYYDAATIHTFTPKRR